MAPGILVEEVEIGGQTGRQRACAGSSGDTEHGPAGPFPVGGSGRASGRKWYWSFPLNVQGWQAFQAQERDKAWRPEGRGCGWRTQSHLFRPEHRVCPGK